MIELKNFSCFYGKSDVVKDVSLKLSDGEVTGLLGANGCGKSTLIKAICRRIQTTGECIIDGAAAPTEPKDLARKLAYIPQRCGVIISLSVLDVVLMGANSRTPAFADYSRDQRSEAAKILRKFCDLPPDADFLSLSEGQKQLVILARAFFQGSGNLLLDEPESALDFDNKHMIMERISTLAKEGKCIMLSLHDPTLALRYCSRLIFMKDGRVTGDIRPDSSSLSELEQLFHRLYTGIQLIQSGGRLILVKA